MLAYHVNNPGRYGVPELNEAGRVLSLKDKPKQLKFFCAVPGLHLCDNQVVDLRRSLLVSVRGDLDITDFNNIYLRTRCCLWGAAGCGYA